MDSEYNYQSSYIWKQTTYDGVLPITNFTEEIKEDELRKRGKDKDKGKELGQITSFTEENGDSPDRIKSKSFSTGSYVYLTSRNQYGIVRSKIDDNLYLMKIKNKETKEFEEMEIDTTIEDVLTEVELSIRVVVSEEKRFSLIVKRSSNDKLKMVAEEIGEYLGLSKYSLTFFYQGDKVALTERIGDRDIGGPSRTSLGNQSQSSESDNFLLCLKGGSEGPKAWKRFLYVDDPCRQLSYISDEEAFDAIQFVPKKNISFAGFSVYHVASTDIDFKVTYKYKIGSESSQEQVAEFSQADVDKKMCDILLDQEIPVSANNPITILVRFQAGDEYFCSTLLGYGGENYIQVPENEDKELFEIRETPDCTKGETDLRFGQIPRIFYNLIA